MRAFEDGITKMLWPSKRDKDFKSTDPISGIGDLVPGPSKILRTTQRSYLMVPAGYLPGDLDKAAGFWGSWLHWIAPWAFTTNGDVRLGPIPKGTPVNLLANIDPLSESTSPGARIKHTAKLVRVLLKLKRDLKSLPPDPTHQQLVKTFTKDVPALLSVSKCPDFIVNKGHYFGTNLSDADKEALIEYIKTF
jgi:hypothetical protein